MYAFDIERPTRLADAVKLLSDSTEATMLGGGQTLIPSLKQRLAAPDRLVCLSGIREIRGICTADDGALCIGGGTCHADVAAGAGAYPALASLAANIGDPAVRNRGTIGGSVANNDPSACYPAAVLGSGATVVTSKRRIAADDFFLGMFETALDDGEIVTEVRFPGAGESELSEIRAAGVAVRPRRGVRGEIRRRGAGRGDRRLRGRRVSLVGGRGGAVIAVCAGGARGAEPAGRRDDLGPARLGRLPGASRGRDDAPGGGRGPPPRIVPVFDSTSKSNQPVRLPLVKWPTKPLPSHMPAITPLSAYSPSRNRSREVTSSMPWRLS